MARPAFNATGFLIRWLVALVLVFATFNPTEVSYYRWVTAPGDGIALHGKLNRGRLGDKPSVLEKGTKVTAKQVVATIVRPKKLQIRVDLEEKNLSVVQVGETCQVTVKAFPDYKGTGIVKSVSKVPYAGTKYDCVITLRKSKKLPPIVPTMTCDLEFLSKESKDLIQPSTHQLPSRKHPASS